MSIFPKSIHLNGFIKISNKALFVFLAMFWGTVESWSQDAQKSSVSCQVELETFTAGTAVSQTEIPESVQDSSREKQEGEATNQSAGLEKKVVSEKQLPDPLSFYSLSANRLSLGDFKNQNTFSRIIALGESAEFKFEGSGGSVVVSPHRIMGSNVSLSVKWENLQGEEIFSSKLKIPQERRLAIGQDDVEGEVRFVFISVVCGKL